MTDVPSWNRVKEIFQASLELPPRERSAFVRKSCGNDAALRAEVESLLDSLDDAGSFAERPAIQSLTVDTPSAGGRAVDVASALETGDALGHYTILALLGAGGMGQVYRARDPKLNRDVALKILPAAFAKDEDRLARFRREAQVLASLNHPNIGHIYGLEDSGARHALVLELVEGPTLAEMIAGSPGRRGVPLDEALPVAQQIAEALEAAHEHGVVHRDLKPANVKVRPDGLVKVLDFGLARALDPAPASSAEAMESPTMTGPQGWTESGVILGTAPYMSPEQARGKVVDKRADIWAFGCVLFEMLTGRRPFGGETSSDTIAAILTREPDWTALPKTTLASLRALLQRCLEKDPKRRLRDIGEARIEIEQLIDESKRAHGPQRRSLGRWIAVSVGLVLLLSIPFAWVYLSKSRAPGRLRFTQLTDFSDSATAASLSPDGRMVTFIRGGSYFQNPNRVGQIYMKVLPNGEPIRLTNDTIPKYAPVFTPDGSRVVYSVQSGGAWDTWTVPIVGGEPTKLLPNATGLSWMNDGRILFSEVKTGIHMGIVTATEARADSREIYFPEHERAMAHYSHASPDRKWVLIVEMGAGGGFTQPCRIVPFDASSKGRLVGPQGPCRAAAWSPGGDWMYFVALIEGRQHLWRQRFPNGEPEQITFDPTEEEGVAVASDGNSIVTSVGEQRSGIWIHDGAGERQSRSEGNATMPRISRDGRWVLFLQENELLQVDVASGKSVSVLPGVKVGFGYDVSADDTELAITRPIEGGRHEIWLASLDRRFAPRLVTRGGDLVTFGPNGTLIFRELDKNANYLARVNRDGSGRERVLSAPILNKTEVSPDGKWAIANQAVEGEGGRIQTIAIPVGGGTPKRICPFNCLPASKWSRDGKYLYLGIGGETAIIPIPPGQALPDLPASGVTSLDDALTLPGARRITQSAVIASLNASTYLFLKTELRRNLFRIQLR